MEEKVEKSFVLAGILGLAIPTSSLFYVKKEGLAVGLMAFFACALLVLIYTPVAYFATSLWIFSIVLISVWTYSFLTGLWCARSGVDVGRSIRGQIPWIFVHLLLILFIVGMFSHIPISFFVIQNGNWDFGKKDIIVAQKNPELKYLRESDYVVFLDDGNETAFAQILALPGDVLKYEEGKITRNDMPCEISIHLPAQSWIVPKDVVLIYYANPNMAKNEAIQESDTKARTKKDIAKDKEQNKYKVSTGYRVMILPFERIKSKALYIFFSTKLSNIGKNLTQTLMF